MVYDWAFYDVKKIYTAKRGRLSSFEVPMSKKQENFEKSGRRVMFYIHVAQSFGRYEEIMSHIYNFKSKVFKNTKNTKSQNL